MPGIGDASTTQTGNGTEVSYSLAPTATTPVYVVVGTLISVDGPKITGGEVEGTKAASQIKPYRSTIAELEMTLSIEHFGSNEACIGLFNMVNGGPAPEVGWRIDYPPTTRGGDGYRDEFKGFAKGYNQSGNENEARQVAEIPVRITSPITRALKPTS